MKVFCLAALTFALLNAYLKDSVKATGIVDDPEATISELDAKVDSVPQELTGQQLGQDGETAKNQQDKVLRAAEIKYALVVKTGGYANANTDGHVYVRLNGVSESTGWYELDNLHRNDFERNHADPFEVHGKDIGVVKNISVQRDTHDTWFLESIRLTSKHQDTIFKFNKWIEACPEGFKELDSMCYRFFNSKYNFFEAQMTCAYTGARVVEINSAEENAFVTELFKKSAEAIWAGLHDVTQNGKFKLTSSGEKLVKTMWGKREPNNAGNWKHCIGVQKAGTWTDYKCDSRLPFVCEMRKGQAKSCLLSPS